MDGQTCTVQRDAAIASLAARQYGVVARRQLLAVGITPVMVEKRLARGTLIRLHRGVYAVGHERLRKEGRWLAAVLAVGPHAVLSHRDAAGLHGLRPANHGRIDVSTPDRGRRDQPGIVVHHAQLTPLDVTVHRGIPTTTVARTLVDLAGAVPKDHLAKALNQADIQRVLDVRSIEEAMGRTRNRPGPGHTNLRQALADLKDHGPTITRSDLEDRFLHLLDEHGLPRPQTNIHIDGIEVDAVWRVKRLAVELDGYTYHRSPQAFQRDREKGNKLAQSGLTLLRYTYADVVDRPSSTAAELARFLA